MVQILFDVAVVLGGSGGYLLAEDADWQSFWLRISGRGASDALRDGLHLLSERRKA